MRRVAPLLFCALVINLAGSVALALHAPVAVRAALGIPLVVLIPGYALARLIFGFRLNPEQTLLISVALTLGLDALGGVALSVSPWGLSKFSWSVALYGATGLLCVAALFRVGGGVRARTRRWPSPGLLATIAVLLASVFLVAIAIGQNRRPSYPPAWASGYTLFWLNARGHGLVDVGLQSGEFENASYRVVVTQGQGKGSWTTGRVHPGGSWRIALRLGRSGRIDAYLYRLGGGSRLYRHVYLAP